MIEGKFLEPFLAQYLPWLYRDTYLWTAVGFAGNIMFSSRFLLQWLASERKRCVVVPAHFWHLSFWGSMLNLFYVLHLDSAPLICGVIALPIIYGRNLILLKRNGYHTEVETPAQKPEHLVPAKA